MSATTPATDSRNWIKRIAAAGFVFYVAKGCVWLLIGGLALAGVW